MLDKVKWVVNSNKTMLLTIEMSCIPISNMQIEAMASLISFQRLDADIHAFQATAWSQQLQVENDI